MTLRVSIECMEPESRFTSGLSLKKGMLSMAAMSGEQGRTLRGLLFRQVSGQRAPDSEQVTLDARRENCGLCSVLIGEQCAARGAMCCKGSDVDDVLLELELELE